MSREEAIDLLDNLIGMVDDNHDSDYDTALKMAIKALEQEPKTGHWIEHRSRATGHIESICSECGAEEGYPYNDYCGNCGARMFEPQESEKINCKSTKCENCINHNYCDYEPQERRGKECTKKI